MKRNQREQYRLFVEQWKRAGPELARVRREELRALDTRTEVSAMDALADIGLRFGTPRESSDLVEMQKWFMKFARQKGLLPAIVRENAPAYPESKLTGPKRSNDAKHLICYKDTNLPAGPKLALFCSVKCPGKLIIETYDLCQRFRVEGIPVISGFHSPMEQECLRILIRSTNPVIWCLARGMIKAIPPELRKAVDEKRLVIVSPFPNKVRRVTVETVSIRNRLVADMAAAVIVAHAAVGGKMESLCRDLLAAGKPVYTFDHPANAAIIQAGARPVTAGTDWKLICL